MISKEKHIITEPLRINRAERRPQSHGIGNQVVVDAQDQSRENSQQGGDAGEQKEVRL